MRPRRPRMRPEATYLIETTMDAAARELGIDALDLRRRNLVRSFPYKTALGWTYDSGDFERCLDTALALLGPRQRTRRFARKVRQPVPALGQLNAGQHAKDLAGLPSSELAALIQELTDQMKAAAAELQFELAARLRDEVNDLKKELRQMMEATK